MEYNNYRVRVITNTLIQYQFAVSGKINIIEKLRAEGFNQRYIDNHLDKYHYFLHSITEKKVFNKMLGADGFVNLNMRTLQSFLGNPYANDIRNNLLSWSYIECNHSYCKNKFSMCYRIHPNFQGKAILRPIHKTETMVRKLAMLSKEYQNKQADLTQRKNLKAVGIHAQEAISFIDKKYFNTLQFISDNEGILTSICKSGVRAEYDSYDTISSLSTSITCIESRSSLYDTIISKYDSYSLSVSSAYPLMCNDSLKKAFNKSHNEGLTAYDILTISCVDKYNTDLLAINKLEHKDYFISRPDPTSRLYTNVSNLSKDLRQFLYHRKETTTTLVNLDIRNSQPYLFSLLLIDKYGKDTLPADVKHYIELTSTGKFYEYMMTQLDIAKERRKEFKIKFFASLFFCENLHAARTEAGKAFKLLFPNVYSLIYAMKVDDYKQLAVTMQRREASIILNTIGKELQRRKIWYVSIHDSLVVTTHNQETVKNLILSAFAATVGTAPTIEAELLNFQENATSSMSELESLEEWLGGNIMQLEEYYREAA